uniref:F-box and WD repeat domain containing 2 n=1 Tax=Eptatretus burgeri TaxID=7764 RepID=A0A8C4QRD9_EPTBU
MESVEFEAWLGRMSSSFLSLSDAQRNVTLDRLIAVCGPSQLRHLSTQLEALLKRDFLRLLPLELCFHLLKWLDPASLLTCCLVSRTWNKVVNGCSQVWLGACRELGGCIPDNGGPQDGRHWKGVYVHASQRLRQLHSGKAFETSVLMGHSARVYALYYRNGLLCTGTTHAFLWDVKTGQCIYGIQTHTCADIKFDEHKLLTASFDNTLACWDWATCTKTKHFLGHTAAVFSVDYSDDLDLLVSGSADFTVKTWSLSTAMCLNTLTGHSEWVTKVSILLSTSLFNILNVWPLGREINCQCLRTLSASEDRSVCLQPRLHCDGRFIVCASDLGLFQWDFTNYQLLRVIRCTELIGFPLLGFGEVFALILHQRSLCLLDIRSETLLASWPLPCFRKSKRGSSFLAGETAWLHGFGREKDQGLVFATSMPDHSIHLVTWSERS